MSQGSCSSKKTCHCGIIANHFTACTPTNPGRKFYKCSRDGADSCGFWEWDDEMYNNRVDDLVRNLRSSLETVRGQKEKLKKKLEFVEKSLNEQVKKAKHLEEKVTKLWSCIYISWAIFIGFALAMLIK